MAARYSKGDTLALNQYMASWAEQQGRILTDDFIKYYFYGKQRQCDQTFLVWVVDIAMGCYCGA